MSFDPASYALGKQAGAAPLDTLTAGENGTYRPQAPYGGFSEVTVDVEPPVFQTTSLTATENGVYYPGTYSADGFDEVTVDVALDTLSVTQNGVYTPDAPYAGFSEVTVDVGGNGSYSFSGTVDDPGFSQWSELTAALLDGSASAQLVIDANTTLGTPRVTADASVNTGSLTFTQVLLDGTLADCMGIQAAYGANGLSRVLVLQNGAVTDMTAYASQLTCTLALYVHPMPSD